jgi:rubrerythrin
MKSIEGTQTQKNLLASFAGESQARMRYTYFSSQAKKEGYEQISFIFADTAENEKEHAKRFFTFLEGGEVEITATYPAGIIGSTAQNLKAAASGENLEHTVLYPEAARVADAEGFKEIARVFREIANVEKEHEKRYLILFKNIETGAVFKRTAIAKWRCRNCGYVYQGAEAPEKCPACDHPQAYYELLAENY